MTELMKYLLHHRDTLDVAHDFPAVMCVSKTMRDVSLPKFQGQIVLYHKPRTFYTEFLIIDLISGNSSCPRSRWKITPLENTIQTT